MEPMLTIALRAARAAGDLIQRASGRLDRVRVDANGHNDFVTEVDRASEQLIIEHLRRAYPDHSFLGEESGNIPGRDPDSVWIIDPLDGTTNFI
ncbi:MAG: inositol monophosphatase, partial [Pseudomonadales bacterium]|nr:inositol monophosphatase [Pseudomonadales bacterium]